MFCIVIFCLFVLFYLVIFNKKNFFKGFKILLQVLEKSCVGYKHWPTNDPGHLVLLHFASGITNSSLL